MPIDVRFSLLFAALFFELGVNLPFFPLWLRSQSLDDAAIGTILAAPLIARIIANPVMTAFADRTGRSGATLAVCAGAVAFFVAFLAVAKGFWPILGLVVLIGLAQGPLIALTDALALRWLQGEPRAENRYGLMRLCGSAGFIAANVGTGYLLGWTSPGSIVAVLFIAAAATAVATLPLARMRSDPSQVRSGGPSAPLASPGRLFLVVIGAGLIQASHAAVYGFSTLHWQTRAIEDGVIGLLWASGVVAEVFVFLLVGRFVTGPRGAGLLLLAGGVAAVLRWIGMAADPSTPWLFALQMAHGLSFAATHLGSVFLLAHLAPASLRAQVQGWLAATWAGGMAVLSSLTGHLYGGWGEHVYWIMAAVALAGAGCIALVVVSRATVAEGPVAGPRLASRD